MAESTAQAAGEVEEKAVDLGILDDLLGFHIRRAQVLNFRQFHKHVADPSVTPTQFAMLVLIEANSGLSQVELGRLLDMDRATTMAVVDKMHSARWISKRRSRADRRKHMLSITDAGGAALQELKASVEAYERQFASGLTATESKQLLSLLKKLYATAGPGDRG